MGTHHTLINGTSYAVTGGTGLANGTKYQIGGAERWSMGLCTKMQDRDKERKRKFP